MRLNRETWLDVKGIFGFLFVVVLAFVISYFLSSLVEKCS